jgi:hypothetical protein
MIPEDLKQGQLFRHPNSDLSGCIYICLGPKIARDGEQRYIACAIVAADPTVTPPSHLRHVGGDIYHVNETLPIELVDADFFSPDGECIARTFVNDEREPMAEPVLVCENPCGEIKLPPFSSGV